MEELVRPILACFLDTDSRVRYYACESLYNVAKVGRGALLPQFNEVFDVLAKLVADPDQNVKSGAELLDRLLKVGPLFVCFVKSSIFLPVSCVCLHLLYFLLCKMCLNLLLIEKHFIHN